jgi:hypothetical protein
VKTVLYFFLIWLAGWYVVAFLLEFYEKKRPRDSDSDIDNDHKRQIEKAMDKFAIGAGFAFAVIWLLIRMRD